ncbi:MAG: cytochrome c oxidase subunit 3 [Deltaproteobacteria bacterium]|nr:cytochrome c oxidase subunit 3 [Deltaproteobacteria bacterium]
MPEAWPTETLLGKATALKIGMWIFLLSDAFSFGALLLSYGVLRAQSSHWHIAGEPEFGINFTAVLTFLLICSSVTMVLAVSACRQRKHGQTLLFLALTILGGLLFLTGQYQEYFGIVGHGLVAEGLHFGQSHRATTFYLITSFHGLHVATGVFIMLLTFIKTALGKYRDGNYDALENVGLFWHFVDLVWILVFTFVYLIPPEAASS